MSVEVTVVCDGCSEVMGAGKTARAARASLRHLSVKLALPGGKDLCPDCAKEPVSA